MTSTRSYEVLDHSTGKYESIDGILAETEKGAVIVTEGETIPVSIHMVYLSK